MRLLLQLSFPQLCAESLTRGASSPSCRRAGGLAEAHHIAGTAEIHSSHLLVHLQSTHTSLVSTGVKTPHPASQKAATPPTSNPVKVHFPKINVSHQMKILTQCKLLRIFQDSSFSRTIPSPWYIS